MNYFYKSGVKFHSLLHSTSNSVEYVPGTIVGARDTAKNKTVLAMKNYSLSLNYMTVCVSGEQRLGTKEIKQGDVYRISSGVGNQILSRLSEGRVSPRTQVS